MDLSTSHKFTLGYAALVGVGGVMGYLKRGSVMYSCPLVQAECHQHYYSTLTLNFQNPNRPTFASSLGLGVSATLVGVMGIRFQKTMKVFPAGVFALLSLGMSGGYLHGILRGQQ